MIKPRKRPRIKLVGTDGNAFLVLGKVRRVLRIAGADKEYINKYMEEATTGDYGHLLQVTMKYVDVE